MTKQRSHETTKPRNNETTNIMSLCRYVVVSFILIAVLALGSQSVKAASVWDTDTVISPPVGTDILPGGQLAAEDIEGHAIFSKIIPFAIDYVIRIAIAASVIVLIFGGYQFMTAYGSTEKHDTARKTITYAAIGLILALTAYAIIAIITSIRLV